MFILVNSFLKSFVRVSLILMIIYFTFKLTVATLLNKKTLHNAEEDFDNISFNCFKTCFMLDLLYLGHVGAHFSF